MTQDSPMDVMTRDQWFDSGIPFHFQWLDNKTLAFVAMVNGKEFYLTTGEQVRHLFKALGLVMPSSDGKLTQTGDSQ